MLPRSDFFENKTAIITGSSRGIGLAIAETYASKKTNCVLLDISDEIPETAKKISEKFRIKTLGIKADISKSEDAENAVKKTVETFGSADFLVNNAGITRDNLLVRMNETEFDDVIRVNLKGAFLMSKAVSRKMIKQKFGRIINISSVVGQMGNAGQSNYSASKAGIIGLTKSLSKELASRNILVNAVAPGFVKTKMTKALKDEVKDKLLEAIPLKRFGEPQDIANAVLFLSGEESSYITGQVIAINGGIYI